MFEPIVPNLDQLRRLWITHCTTESAAFGDHHKAAAHNQSRIGFDLKIEEIKRAAAGRPAGGFAVCPDPDDRDVVVVTNARGQVRRVHREDADPEHRFAFYRLAAGWFGNLPTPEPTDEDPDS